MKKLLTFFTIFAFALFLVSCKPDDGGNGGKVDPDETIDVTLKDSSLNGNTYDFTFTVNSSFEENLTSIAYTTAHEIYEEIKGSLDNSKSYFLNITFEIGGVVKLEQRWQINRNIENPGLELLN